MQAIDIQITCEVDDGVDDRSVTKWRPISHHACADRNLAEIFPNKSLPWHTLMMHRHRNTRVANMQCEHSHLISWCAIF